MMRCVDFWEYRVDHGPFAFQGQKGDEIGRVVPKLSTISWQMLGDSMGNSWKGRFVQNGGELPTKDDNVVQVRGDCIKRMIMLPKSPNGGRLHQSSHVDISENSSNVLTKNCGSKYRRIMGTRTTAVNYTLTVLLQRCAAFDERVRCPTC